MLQAGSRDVVIKWLKKREDEQKFFRRELRECSI
jgi:hypothetical protein